MAQSGDDLIDMRTAAQLIGCATTTVLRRARDRQVGLERRERLYMRRSDVDVLRQPTSPARVSRTELTCSVCGTLFFPRDRLQRFCSRRCGVRHRYGLLHAHTMSVRAAAAEIGVSHTWIAELQRDGRLPSQLTPAVVARAKESWTAVIKRTVDWSDLVTEL